MDNDPTEQIIIEQLQDHITIQKLIQEKRAITNARNRHNYSKRKDEGRNKQLKSTSQLQPKERKLKPITEDDIQVHISKQIKPTRAIRRT